jgi:hypothetical protein
MRNDDKSGRFIIYHLRNPDTWFAYEKVILDSIERGRPRGGVKAVTETIRWSEPTITTLTNDFDPFYARMFAATHPEHKDFFEYKSSAADYINYEPLLRFNKGGFKEFLNCPIREVSEEALGWEDPQLVLELEEEA